jgi:hypothetical protein
LRFVVHLLTLIVVALVVGFGLSWYALTDGRLFGAHQVGPWLAWPQVGQPGPDPYTRAFLARAGTMQLGLSEGLQFVAATDSDGRRLDRSCRYRLDGRTPIAQFWTLAATGADGISVAPPDGPPSVRSNRIPRTADGSIVLYVSRTLAPQTWFEIAGDGPFALVLTLYDTSIFAGVGSGVETLPSILREACA